VPRARQTTVRRGDRQGRINAISDPFLSQVLTGLLVNGIYDVAKRLLQFDEDAESKRAFLRNELASDAGVEEAVAQVVARFTEVEAIDPDVGGERLRAFLQSSDAAEIISQAFSFSFCATAPGGLQPLKEEFVALLSAWTGLNTEDVQNRAEPLFDSLLEATQRALDAAISHGALEAHEANSALRYRLLEEQLANIARNTELLTQADRVSLDTIHAFELEYRAQVAGREAFVVPPNLDNNQKKRLEQLYVTPRFRTPDRPSAEDGEPATYDDLVADLHRAVLLGDPGGGKSTFAQRLCLDLASQNTAPFRRGRRITPILVILREYGAAKERDSLSLLEFIERAARTRYQMPDVPTGAMEYLLRNGRALVVFDGLDELLDTTYRQEITADVEAFCNYFTSVPALVTSRKIGYDQAPLDPDTFEIVLLEEFDEEQIRQYATKWFVLETDLPAAERTKKTEGFLEESKIVPDLRSNPLMLGLLCNIYRGERYIPSNRPEVFEKCAVMLFERWDRGRGIDVAFPFQSRLRPAMQRLAYSIYRDPRLQGGVTEGWLVSETADYLCPRQFEEMDDAREAAEEFVELSTGRAWVFTDTGTTASGERLFQFTHRTFLEYFAAGFLVRNSKSLERLLETLAPRIEEREWDVVAQLAFQIQTRSLEDAADGLLLGLLIRAQDAPPAAKANVLSFAGRALEFLVPSPRVTREVVRETLAAAIDQSVASGVVHLPSQEWASDSDVNAVATGQALVAAATSAGAESVKVASATAHEYLTGRLQTADGTEALAVEEIALHLQFGHLGSRGASGWQQVAEAIANDSREKILALAREYFQVAFDAALLRIMTLEEVVAAHGTEALLRPRYYTVFTPIRSMPLASFSVWRAIGPHADTQSDESKQEGLDNLQSIGELLAETPPPWTREHPDIYLGFSRPSQPTELDDWSEAQRFGAWAVIAIEAESVFGSKSHGGRGEWRRSVFHGEDVSGLFGSLLDARFGSGDAGAANHELELFGPTSRDVVERWIKREVDLVQGRAPGRPAVRRRVSRGPA
jgi:hypothetical protein